MNMGRWQPEFNDHCLPIITDGKKKQVTWVPVHIELILLQAIRVNLQSFINAVLKPQSRLSWPPSSPSPSPSPSWPTRSRMSSCVRAWESLPSRVLGFASKILHITCGWWWSWYFQLDFIELMKMLSETKLKQNKFSDPDTHCFTRSNKRRTWAFRSLWEI